MPATTMRAGVPAFTSGAAWSLTEARTNNPPRFTMRPSGTPGAASSPCLMKIRSTTPLNGARTTAWASCSRSVAMLRSSPSLRDRAVTRSTSLPIFDCQSFSWRRSMSMAKSNCTCNSASDRFSTSVEMYMSGAPFDTRSPSRTTIRSIEPENVLVICAFCSVSTLP